MIIIVANSKTITHINTILSVTIIMIIIVARQFRLLTHINTILSVTIIMIITVANSKTISSANTYKYYTIGDYYYDNYSS